jgi:hypothetical protein
MAMGPLATAAQDTRGIRARPSDRAETRVALVIGNGAYRSAPLRNPVNDATAMAEALRGCGFQATLLLNASRERMFTAIRDFGNALQGSTVGVFYFAGHGVQVHGKNYLVPVDTDLASEDEVAYSTLDTEAVLAKLETAHNPLNIVILDACRNNPFGRSFRSSQQGLAQMDAPAGTYIAFATAPGHTAADGAEAHGLYTGNLLAQMGTPGLKVEDLFKRVRARVMEASSGLQVPWESSSITGDFYFNPGAEGTVAGLNPSPATDLHRPLSPLPAVARALEVKRDGRFIAYDDRTVLDSDTGLMWANRDNGFDIPWEKAKAYCQQFRMGGYTDWRLPTMDELASLYDGNQKRPASCNTYVGVGVASTLIDITCFWVWASETRKAFFGDNIGAFSFATGKSGWLQGGQGTVRRVIPVRLVPR